MICMWVYTQTHMIHAKLVLWVINKLSLECFNYSKAFWGKQKENCSLLLFIWSFSPSYTSLILIKTLSYRGEKTKSRDSSPLPKMATLISECFLSHYRDQWALSHEILPLDNFGSWNYQNPWFNSLKRKEREVIKLNMHW